MENASKALIMAGGILIGILILTLIFTLTQSTKDMSTTYEIQKKEETIQQFNVNFTKYLGQDLTIHDVVTICNFTSLENNKIAEVKNNTKYNETNIKGAIQEANHKLSESTEYYKIERVYSLKIVAFNNKTGYVSEIEICEKNNDNFKFKCYKKVKNESTNKNEIKVDYTN